MAKARKTVHSTSAVCRKLSQSLRALKYVGYTPDSNEDMILDFVTDALIEAKSHLCLRGRKK